MEQVDSVRESREQAKVHCGNKEAGTGDIGEVGGGVNREVSADSPVSTVVRQGAGLINRC